MAGSWKPGTSVPGPPDPHCRTCRWRATRPLKIHDLFVGHSDCPAELDWEVASAAVVLEAKPDTLVRVAKLPPLMAEDIGVELFRARGINCNGGGAIPLLAWTSFTECQQQVLKSPTFSLTLAK